MSYYLENAKHRLAAAQGLAEHYLGDKQRDKTLSLLRLTDEDRKPVVFCAIHELEGVLPIATEDSLLAALKFTQKVQDVAISGGLPR